MRVVGLMIRGSLTSKLFLVIYFPDTTTPYGFHISHHYGRPRKSAIRHTEVKVSADLCMIKGI